MKRDASSETLNPGYESLVIVHIFWSHCQLMKDTYLLKIIVETKLVSQPSSSVKVLVELSCDAVQEQCFFYFFFLTFCLG